MERKCSRERAIITLVGGATRIVEEYYVCLHCKDLETGRRVINHSEPLHGIIPYKSKYGYDVEVEAGHLQYVDNLQIDEIKRRFESGYGLVISQSQIHELGIRFLKHMVVLHYAAAPLLKKLFEEGCVYHVDATCEAGRGMEMAVIEGWSGIILGVWKITTENEDVIKKNLKSVVEQFGEPAAFVSDMGNGMMAAISSVILEMQLKSRQLVCHMHFLKAVGKCIFESSYKLLKTLLKGQKTLADLNRFVKETGNIIEPQAAAMRGFVVRWKESSALLDIPGHVEGAAVLRALAQWVLLFSQNCDGEGFPFELSHVHLYERCSIALNSLMNFKGKGTFRSETAKLTTRLQQILQSVVKDTSICKAVQNLMESAAVFTELREVLRLEKADVYKQEKDKKTPDTLEAVKKLKEETGRYCDTLSKRLESGAVTSAQQHAMRTILAYFEQYGPYLFNHHFVTYDASGNDIIKLIERSNNIMEQSFRGQKHQIRRRTGIKNLGFVYEHLFPAASMTGNFNNPVYKQLVLGNKSRGDLTGLFSQLDDIMDYYETPMYQYDYEAIGGRMPKADKSIVGHSSFTNVIYMMSDAFTKTPLYAGT